MSKQFKINISSISIMSWVIRSHTSINGNYIIVNGILANVVQTDPKRGHEYYYINIVLSKWDMNRFDQNRCILGILARSVIPLLFHQYILM